MLPNDKEDHVNPLFAKTDGFTAAPGWATPPPVEEPVPVVLQITSPPIGEESPKKQIQVVNKKETHQPSTHDMRSPIPYQIRYRKLNAMIDKRLLPYWQHVMGLTGNFEYGASMTASFNEMFLRFLLHENFEIDPDLLKHPFTWEVYADLPPEE